MSSYYLSPLSGIKFNDTDFKAELVVKGLTRPTGMIFLDDNDMLIAEKQGAVQRINGNEILQYAVLDIRQIVNDTGERGLLSIAVSHPKDEGKDQKNKSPVIYVMFTNEQGKNSTNSSCLPQSCRNLENVFNSLYRYDFKDGVMVNPKLLANIPLYSNESIQHIGGAVMVGPDKKLYFTGGDGRGCEYFEDCAAKTSYFTGNNETKSNGGIFFLTDNPHVVSNGTLHEYYQYAYGVRNSFGLDFDPVTGNLWDTENGPAFVDEINLVEPGFNSGWPKYQGIWSVTNYSQLFNNPLRACLMDITLQRYLKIRLILMGWGITARQNLRGIKQLVLRLLNSLILTNMVAILITIFSSPRLRAVTYIISISIRIEINFY